MIIFSSTHMKFSQRKIILELKRRGYKVTPQRRAVIEAVMSSPAPVTPGAVYARVRRDYPTIGLVTIYRTLDILAGLEIICELHGEGTCHTYTIGMPEHHHHLICSSCGTVIDFTSHNLAELEQSLSRKSGFRIDGHLLEFFGLCAVCQKG